MEGDPRQRQLIGRLSQGGCTRLTAEEGATVKAIVNVPICPLLDRPGPVGGDYPTVVDEALYGMVVELLESPPPAGGGSAPTTAMRASSGRPI